MDLKNLEKSKIVSTLLEQKFLVYGRPRIGKTTFANQFPKPLFLATEAGHSHLECYKISIHNWKEFLTACAEIRDQKHDFQTIIIDTVDNLHDFCSEYICTERKIEHPSDMPMGKGYGFVNTEFKRAPLGNKIIRDDKWGRCVLIKIAHPNKYKAEHIVVAEKYYRKLEKGECVHHIDCNPFNNLPKNL